jgi:hypothetical protein
MFGRLGYLDFGCATPQVRRHVCARRNEHIWRGFASRGGDIVLSRDRSSRRLGSSRCLRRQRDWSRRARVSRRNRVYIACTKLLRPCGSELNGLVRPRRNVDVADCSMAVATIMAPGLGVLVEAGI